MNKYGRSEPLRIPGSESKLGTPEKIQELRQKILALVDNVKDEINGAEIDPQTKAATNEDFLYLFNVGMGVIQDTRRDLHFGQDAIWNLLKSRGITATPDIFILQDQIANFRIMIGK